MNVLLHGFLPTLLLLTLTVPAAGDDTDTILPGLLQRREELYQRVEQRIQANQAAGIRNLELHVLDALTHGGNQRMPLHIRLVIHGQDVQIQRVWSPRYNRAEHDLRFSAWSFSDTQGSGRLRLMLQSDGFQPPGNENVLLELVLRLPLGEDSGPADYDLILPAGPGETPLSDRSGMLKVVDRTPGILPLPPLPDAPAAARLEAYRQCRALAMALVHNRTLDACLQDTILAFDPTDDTLPARLLQAAQEDPVAAPAGPAAPKDRMFGPWTPPDPLAPGDPLPDGNWFRPYQWRHLAGVPVPVQAEIELRTPAGLLSGPGDILSIGDRQLLWQTVQSEAFGLVPAPDGEAGHLAQTQLLLDAPGRVWIALTPWLHELGRDTYAGRARIWIDDDLIWTADSRDRQQAQAMAIFHVDLPAGTHRLTVQAWRRNGGPAPFRLALRRGGEPLSGRALAERDAAQQAQVDAEQTRLAEQVTGDRVNWRGRVPEAGPPLAWNQKEGQNIVWRTPLPDGTIAAPVVSDDRIFTVGNPHHLHCLDARDGSLLWSRSFDVRELLSETQQQELAAAATRAQEAWTALQETREPSEEDKPRWTRIVQAYHTLSHRFGIDCVQFTDPDWRSFRQGHYMNYGAASSAPVTDGRHVWARNIEGAVACFDRNGNRRWMIQLPVLDYDGIPSPLLIDGMLIVEGHHPPPLLNRNRQKREKWMVGIDADSGLIRWRTQLANPKTMQGVGVTSLAPPIPVAVSDGKQARTVIVTVTGTVVDPATGRVLADIHLGTGGTRQNQGYPVAEGNRVVFAGQARHSAMVELLPVGDDIGIRRIWHSVCRHNNYGALLHDGNVWQHSWWFGARPWKGHISSMELVALDQQDGRIVHLMEHVHRDIAETTTFPQLLLTHGDVLWAGSTRTAPGSPHRNQATLSAIRLEASPYVLARNLVEPYAANPVAAGNRLYIRTLSAMLCIGYTGEEGRRYEQDIVAQTILNELPPRPVVTHPREVTPDYPFARVPQAHAWPVRSGPLHWQYRLTNAPPETFLPADNTPPDALAPLRQSWQEPPNAAWLERNDGRALDLLRIPGVQDRPGFFFTLAQIDQRGVFRFELKGGHMFRAWLAGRPVDDQELLRLQPGVYSLLIETRLQARLPFRQLVMLPQLIPEEDPARLTRQWRQALQQRIPALTAIVAAGDDRNGAVALAAQLLNAAEDRD